MKAKSIRIVKETRARLRLSKEILLSTRDRDTFEKLYYESYAQYDKQLSFVASGALIVSIALIEKIVKLETARGKWVFSVGLISLAITLLLSVAGQYAAVKSYGTRLKSRVRAMHKIYDRIVDLFNLLTFLVMVVGILFITMFVVINI